MWALNLISFFFSITLTDIRHPEELSLLRPIEHKKKKKDKGSAEEVYDLTQVPLSSGTLTRLHLVSTYFRILMDFKKETAWVSLPNTRPIIQLMLQPLFMISIKRVHLVE